MMQTPEHAILPLRRTEALSTQRIADEALIYDERTHKAFCLNPTAALIWQQCDGTHTSGQIAASISPQSDPLSAEAVVHVTLLQLAKDDLITGYRPVNHAGLSRRTMLAQTGAGMALMLPVIAMVAAPKAAQAYLGCVDCSSAASAAQRQHITTPDRQNKSSSTVHSSSTPDLFVP